MFFIAAAGGGVNYLDRIPNKSPFDVELHRHLFDVKCSDILRFHISISETKTASLDDVYMCPISNF
jgi:hypothetical protein